MAGPREVVNEAVSDTASCINENDVIRYRDDISLIGATESLYFPAVSAHQSLDLTAAQAGDGLCHVVYQDDGPGLEVTLHLCHAAGEKAFVVMDCAGRPGIDRDCAS